MISVIEYKLKEHLQYSNLPNSKSLHALKDARKIFSKQLVLEYMRKNSGKKIQLAANTGNIRLMYI